MMSVLLPAGNGTIRWIGRSGHWGVCAAAAAANMANAASRILRILSFLPPGAFQRGLADLFSLDVEQCTRSISAESPAGPAAIVNKEDAHDRSEPTRCPCD